MTKNEKEVLAEEVHKEAIRRIGGHLRDVVNAAIKKRLPEVNELEVGYPLGRQGSSWSYDEETVLRHEMVAAIAMIATAHRRTPGGIRERLKNMGIIADYSLLV